VVVAHSYVEPNLKTATHSEEGTMNAPRVAFENLTDAQWLLSKPRRNVSYKLSWS
jgi:hypothetical protein